MAQVIRNAHTCTNSNEKKKYKRRMAQNLTSNCVDIYFFSEFWFNIYFESVGKYGINHIVISPITVILYVLK